MSVRLDHGEDSLAEQHEINVTPFIDVMLVLLIIFMVTAPMMQQGLQVNLPQARRADPINAQPVTVTVTAAQPSEIPHGTNLEHAVRLVVRDNGPGLNADGHAARKMGRRRGRAGTLERARPHPGGRRLRGRHLHGQHARRDA